MFEAYKIGIKLSLIDGATAGLIGLASRFKHASANAAELETRIKRIQALALKGGALIGAGIVGFKLLEGPIHAAREYTHQLELMNQVGMSHAEIAASIRTAYANLSTTPTAGLSEQLKTIRELRGVFVHPDDALKYAGVVLQAEAMLSAQLPGISRGQIQDQAYQAAKAIEMANGARSPAEFLKQMDMMTKASVALGGRIGANDFLSAAKYGRMSAQGWNDEFRYNYLPTLIQEMKSSKGAGNGMGGPANALMTLYSQVVQGTIAQRYLPEWIKDGLISKRDVIWNKVGSAKGVKPGAVIGSAEFIENPYAWAQKYMVPMLQKQGVDINNSTQLNAALSKFGFSRTAGQVMSIMIAQAYKFERDKQLIAQAKGIGGYQELVKKDPMLASIALHQQWESLLATLGYQIMPVVLKGTLMLINGLQSLSLWFHAHPTLTKTLMGSLAALSALLVTGGVILSLRALAMAISMVGGALVMNPVGLIITGIVVAIGVAAYFLWKNWDTVKPKLLATWHWITQATTDILQGAMSLWQSIKEGFHSFVGGFLDGWQSLFNLLIGGINKILPNAMAIGRVHFADDWNGPQASYSNEGYHRGSPYVASKSQRTAPLKGDVFLDKRKVGSVMWSDAGHQASRALGTGMFDAGLAMPIPSLNH